MKVSYRIGRNDWYPEEAFSKLLKQVERWKDSIDELALFVECSHHGYWSLEFVEDSARVLRDRMSRLRRAGIPSVGINVLITLGHVDEAWDWWPLPPFQTVVDWNGRTTLGMPCMRAPEYRPYIREKYRLLAASGPDFIWYDDDLRVHHHTAEFPCFCHRCITGFNQKYGYAFFRESLVKAVNDPSQAEVRRRWLQYNRDELDDMVADLSRTIREVDPKIILGHMSSGTAWNDYGLGNVEPLVKAMDAKKLRPGGGFYDDSCPSAMIGKLIDLGEQVKCGKGIEDIQYEHEDFPHCSRKSVRMHRLEWMGSLMIGCNGIAMDNLFPFAPDPLMQAIRDAKDAWKKIADTVFEWNQRGYMPMLTREFAARTTGNLFSHRCSELWSNETALVMTGIPAAYEPEHADFCVLSGEMAEALEEDTVLKMLSGGVLMDAEAMMCLEKRGYGELLGCRIEKTWHSGMKERYTDDPLNELQGEVRDSFMTFWNDAREGVSVYTLTPDKNARVLSILTSVTGVDCGASAVAYENRLGGRVAVFGYMPWTFLVLPGKRGQIHRLAEWLSYGRPSLRLSCDGSDRLVPFVRMPDEGKGFALYVVNSGYDDSGEITAEFQTQAGRETCLMDETGKEWPLDAARIETTGSVTRVTLPSLEGWHAWMLLSRGE